MPFTELTVHCHSPVIVEIEIIPDFLFAKNPNSCVVVSVQNGSLHQKETVHDNDFEPYLTGQSTQVRDWPQVIMLTSLSWDNVYIFLLCNSEFT